VRYAFAITCYCFIVVCNAITLQCPRNLTLHKFRTSDHMQATSMGAVSVEKLLTIKHVVGSPILPDSLCTKISKCDYKFFFQTRYATLDGRRCDAIHMRAVKCDDTFTHTVTCHRVTFICLTSTILVE